MRPGYSCAGICWSDSRHALIFKRRQTQQSPSAELGAHGEPQTTHFAVSLVTSLFNACCALSRISLETTVSGGGTGFRFIVVS